MLFHHPTTTPPTPLLLVALCATAVLRASPAAAQQATEPVASAQAAPPQDATPTTAERSRVRFGALAGIGFPRPLAVEALATLGPRLALGAEYGVLPTISVGGVDASLWSVAGDVRVFPFGGAFFVGLRAGRQHVEASTSIGGLPYVGSLSETLAFDSWFINPRLGFMWTTTFGLALALEAGVQFPLAASTSSTLPLSLVPAAQHTADSIGGAVLPTLDLLRLGVLL